MCFPHMVVKLRSLGSWLQTLNLILTLLGEERLDECSPAVFGECVLHEVCNDQVEHTQTKR